MPYCDSCKQECGLDFSKDDSGRFYAFSDCCGDLLVNEDGSEFEVDPDSVADVLRDEARDMAHMREKDER
jgi:hypothetical protein